MNANDQLTTVVISHDVAPGHEGDFVAWQDRVVAAVQQFPGFVSAERVPPVHDAQQSWTVIYRFSSPDAHDAWAQSDVRKQLQAEAPEFANFKLATHLGDFAGWIPSKNGDPPRWKSATAVFTAFYPTAVLLTFTIAKLLTAVGIDSLWLVSFIINIIGVAFLTWSVMPLLVKVIGFWLVPDGTLTSKQEAAGLGVNLAFWVITAVICYFLTLSFG